jgi:outer membrane protein assembly factor BamB
MNSTRVFQLAIRTKFALRFPLNQADIMIMTRSTPFTALLLATLTLTSATQAANWPNWRGPTGNSISPETAFATRWSATENVLWKTKLPDRGNSSPIVWGDKVFVTQAIEKEGRRTVMAFDRKTGRQLWQSGTVFKTEERTHDDNPYCSASPATDGERVYAGFGSAGIFCFDMDGKELWHRDLGPQSHIWGNASSPVIYRDLCIIYHGPGEGSFLTALHKKTGAVVWKTVDDPVITAGRTDGFKGQEPGITGSFSTPVLIPVQGHQELVMSYHNRLTALNPETGTKIWWSEGLNPMVYTSPVWTDDIIVSQGGYFGNTIAVRPGGKGDVTATHRKWQLVRDKGGIGSGVIKDGRFYYLNSNSLITCMNLETGTTLWEERVAGAGPKTSSWSSMVLAGDRIYLLNQSGATLVLKAGPEFEVIAVNSIGNEMSNSTHALSDGDIFIRTHENLWCIRSSGNVAVN